MTFLRGLLALFLSPGNLVINAIGISIEDDGGIIRSTVNMIFWSVLALLISLPFILG